MSDVIRFKQEAAEITCMIQIDYKKVPFPVVSVNRSSMSKVPRYFITAFISSWNELDVVKGPLQDLERRLRSGRVTVEADDTKLFSLVAGELQET